MATAVPHEGERGESGFDPAAPVAREGQAEAASFLVEAIAFHTPSTDRLQIIPRDYLDISGQLAP